MLASGFRFPKKRRILHSAEFGEIMKQGGFAADQNLVVNARVASKQALGGVSVGRLGVTIPKKTGNAVVRNRWKRLIREAFRLEQHHLPTGFDLVVKPRRDAKPNFHSLRRSLPRLALRASKTTTPGTNGTKSKARDRR